MNHDDFYRMDPLLDRFDRDWNSGLRPKIEDVLYANSEVDESELLQELMLIELEYRRKAKEAISPSDYVERFPSHQLTIFALFTQLEDVDKGTEPTLSLPAQWRRRKDEAAPRQMKIGPYDLERILGSGAFGEVWLGKRHGKLATTEVAIKIPRTSEQTCRILQEEAGSWVRASGHPNVVPIIEADIYDGQMAIVSEYVEGGTLAAMLEREGRLPEEGAVEIAIGILCGLEYLHARGIVHRDLKPANVLLQHGIPRVTDFGLAQTDVSATGIAGTPSYMAPEAFVGHCSVATDLWSVGIILYELLTDHTPFQADELCHLVDIIRYHSPLPLTGLVSAELSRIILKALEKEPSNRFRSAADMRASLSDYRRRLGQQEPGSSKAPLARHRSITVTGTMQVEPSRVRKRLTEVLNPYLAPLTTWYTGSYGIVDEQAAEILVDQKQRMYFVGYSNTDVSATASKLIAEHEVPFIDAEHEDVPPEWDAPSQRDIFFATKSDLVILVWDGQSHGTERLLLWLKKHQRDHLVVYI